MLEMTIFIVIFLGTNFVFNGSCRIDVTGFAWVDLFACC